MADQATDHLFAFDPAEHRTIQLVQLDVGGAITRLRGRRLSSDIVDALTYGQDHLATR